MSTASTEPLRGPHPEPRERRRFGEIEPESPWRFHEVPRIFLHHRHVALIGLCALGLVAGWLAVNHSPRMAVALFCAVVGGVAIVFAPFLGVLAYFNLTLMRPQELFWGLANSRLAAAIAGATIVAALIHYAVRPNLDFIRRKQNFFILVLWLFIYLSTQLGDFGVPEPKWMSYYNKMFLMYFIVLSLMTSERKLWWLAWIVVISIGTLTVWANKMHFLEGLYTVHGPGRPGDTFYDENDFAMVMVMGVPFLWYLMRYTRNRILKAGLLLMLPVAAHAIFVTFSRGGFLGLASVTGLIAIRDKNRALGTFVIACGVVFFIVFAGDRYRARIGSIDDYESDKSASGRLESWEAGLNMAVHNPFFGVGLKQYQTAFPYYSNHHPLVAHNSWVQIGAEAGLVALGSYGMLVLLTWRSLRRIRRRWDQFSGRHGEMIRSLTLIYEATLAGYLVCGFFLSMEDFEFFYLLVGMVLVLDRITEKRAEERRAGERATASAAAARPIEARAG